jgi:hypothetical protein
VPGGTFDVREWTLSAGDHTWTWSVEEASPHRLIRWTGPGGEVGELTGVIRSPYWTKNHEGDESLRRELGLGDPSWLGAPAPAGGPTP